jgi:hypothetical protein
VFATFDFAELLIFPRALHEYERQIVREYIAARYAIAAPSLTGVDRDIMSLLPFAWLDPAAANILTGKATAFLDRARPGHTFAQATNGNQVATPTVSADFNGQLVATAIGSSFYDSSLPATAWDFLFNGGGCDITVLTKRIGGIGSAWPLLSSNTAAGLGTTFGSTNAGALAVGNWNGTAYALPPAGTIAGAFGTNAPVRVRHFYKEANSPKYGLSQNANVLTGNSVAAPAATGSSALRWFGRRDAAWYWVGDVAAGVVFNRVLTAQEHTKFVAALVTKFGAAAA